jgi:tRNA threonylcarbamoyladenosine biosynthesis protein TsaE
MALGERWGREAKTGWVIGLTGELGAGKTQLVKGIARGLGVPDGVHSPTFVLINEYRTGRLPLFHLDLYRLESRDQIAGAGLVEYLDQPEGVVVIEWAERWFGDGPHLGSSAPHRSSRWSRVNIETLSECERLIKYEDFGP